MQNQRIIQVLFYSTIDIHEVKQRIVILNPSYFTLWESIIWSKNTRVWLGISAFCIIGVSMFWFRFKLSFLDLNFLHYKSLKCKGKTLKIKVWVFEISMKIYINPRFYVYDLLLLLLGLGWMIQENKTISQFSRLVLKPGKSNV